MNLNDVRIRVDTFCFNTKYFNMKSPLLMKYPLIDVRNVAHIRIYT